MTEPKSNKYYREQMYSFYYRRLDDEEVGLKDVPEWLLEDTTYGAILYEIAFDPRRKMKENQYKENIVILERGIEKARENGDTYLLANLQEIYEAHRYWQGLLPPQEQQTEPQGPELEERKLLIDVAFSVLAIGGAFVLILIFRAIANAVFG